MVASSLNRDDKEKPMVIAIVGPTASGKSAVGLELAKRIDGEIISGDSMQVYRGMDIGTAKASREDLASVRHHLIDVVDPCDEFNVASYQKLAQDAIADITARGKMPIMVGGTGMYIDSVLNGFLFPYEGKNGEVRERLVEEGELLGSQALHERLEDVDPEAASKIHPNDLRRIVRALEVFITTGEPISSLQKNHKANKPYKSVYFGLYVERQILWERTAARVDDMIERGLVDEVRMLMASGFAECLIAMQAIGYKEIVEYIRGEIPFEKAVELVKIETRKYAKRQMTWFKRNESINWIDTSENSDVSSICDYIEKALVDSVSSSTDQF